MVTCKNCGKPDLAWKQLSTGWRLFNPDGSRHGISECHAFKAKQTFNQIASAAANQAHLTNKQLYGAVTKSEQESLGQEVIALGDFSNVESLLKKAKSVAPDSINRLVQAALDKKTRGEKRAPKPRGFWKKAPATILMQKFVDGQATLFEVYASLVLYTQAMGTSEMGSWSNLKWQISRYIKESTSIPQVKKDELLKLLDASEVKAAGVIKWGKFFNLETEEQFDLQRLASMVYASEQILRADGELIASLGLQGLKRQAEGYVVLWANRFAKYVLAACLGEWRHRHVAGAVDLGVPPNRGGRREAMQTAAVLLWGDTPHLTDEARKKISIALTYMSEHFGDKGFFTGGGVGGPRWAKIASTLLKWIDCSIPDVVWVDYVWDIVHNGGCLFNKAQGMFQHEQATRTLLSLKRNSKSGNVLEWGRAHLHPEFSSGLEEIVNMQAMLKESEKSWIGDKLGGQTLFGGDD